jgi:predicted DNA-binding transcriptional regulator YafY
VAIADLLQARGRMTAAQLAGVLEVSPRTILRDISELSSAGIPVYAVRGGAGGFELLSGYAAAPAGPHTAGRTAAAAPAGATRAHILLSPRGRRLVALSGRSADFRARHSASPLAIPPGWTEGWLRTGPHEQAVLDLLGFGTEVEVISPPELRRAVLEHAQRITRRHEDPRRL